MVSAALVNILERVPLNSADAFVAFTGLDPCPDESGKHRGKRRLSKRGPARVLYLAAMSAIKTQAWKPLYEHYRAKGLSSTATFVILARRIARTAWSMYTYKTEFDPMRLTKALTWIIESFLRSDGRTRPVPAIRIYYDYEKPHPPLEVKLKAAKADLERCQRLYTGVCRGLAEAKVHLKS